MSSKPFDERTSVPSLNYKTTMHERSFWDKTKKFGNKLYEEVKQPLLQGTQNVVDVTSPVETNISELPSINDAIDDAFTVDESEVGFKVYRRMGELAKLKEGLGEASKEDVDTYNQNLKRLVTENLGYDGLGFNRDTGKYLVKKEGNWKELDPTLFQKIVAEAIGDKAEIYGAIAGAKAGTKIAPGLWKVPMALLGGSVGAGLGSMVDTTAGILSTGQKLSTKQFLDEAGKSALLDATGAVVGGALIKVAGKTLQAPKKAIDLLLKGNIDGAKKILKSDLKLEHNQLEDAFTQLQASQKEQYGKGFLKGTEKKQEELLASTMAHPQGERIVKEAVQNNPKASFELEKSIDQRAKQVLDGVDGVDGKTIKKYVDTYEDRVKKQYKSMRSNFKNALKETDYRFDLDSLGLDKSLDDLSTRVVDPNVKARFEGMVGAIENIVEQSKNGKGVERDIDSLLDIRQMMNGFYRKNKNAFALAPDKRTFKEMVGSIDKEIDNALEKVNNPELKDKLLKSFDDARESYKAFYDVADTHLYQTLMGKGKSAEERVTALLKHVKDDNGEFQALLKNLDPVEQGKVEETILKGVLEKNTHGNAGEIKSIDYASVVDEFEKLKPFVKNENTLESMRLVAEMNKKFAHDFAMAKVVKGVRVNTSSGGIATTIEGIIRAVGAKKLFDYIQTIIPFFDGPKRLALQRHIGKALERSRTPVEMARKLINNPDMPKPIRSDLTALIRSNNAILRAKSEKAKKEALAQNEKISAEIEAKKEAKVKAIGEFKTPSSEELKTVEKLHHDDKTATMARTIRTIQEGKATTADVERYIDAKEKINPVKFEKFLNKEQVAQLGTKYKDVGDKEIKELESLRDFMLTKEGAKLSSVVHPQKFKKLLHDLKTKGVPRSLEYDKTYNELRGVYHEFKDEIEKAYPSSNSNVMDDFGNPLFGIGAVGAGLGAGAEVSRADESLDKLLKVNNIYNKEIDMNDFTKKIKELDAEIDFTKNKLTGISDTDRASTVQGLEELRDDLKRNNTIPYHGLLELIAKGEGTSKEKALEKGYKSEYDVTLGYGAYVDDKSLPISFMTLSELMQTQRKMLRNKKNRWNSSAVGKYQITRTTLKYLMKKMQLKGTERFTPELQDKMAIELLKRRGLNKFKSGRITLKDFHNRLSKEWASIARHGSKKGSYGQHVGTSSDALASSLEDIRNA